MQPAEWIKHRLIATLVVTVVAFMPVAIPGPAIFLQKWIAGQSQENPGFLLTPIENQTWFLAFGSVALLILLLSFGSLKWHQYSRIQNIIIVSVQVWFLVVSLRALFTAGILWSYTELFVLAGSLVVFWATLLAAQRDVNLIRKFAMVSIPITFTICAIAILQNFGADPLPYSETVSGRNETIQGKNVIASTFGHPNYMGSFLVPQTLLLIGYGATFKGRLIQVILGLLTCLVIYVLLLAGTRGPFIAFVAGMMTFIVLNSTSGRFSRWFVAGAGTLILVLVAVLYFSPEARPGFLIQDRIFATKEIATRTLYWAAGLHAFSENPILGIGVGQFDEQFARILTEMPATREGEIWYFALSETIRGVRPGYMHNDHLQILVELGLIGFSAWVTLWATLLGSAVGGLRISSPYYVGLISAMVAFFIDAVFSFPFHIPCSAVLFWFIVALFINANGPPYCSKNPEMQT